MGCTSSVADIPSFPDIPHRLKNSFVTKLIHSGSFLRRDREVGPERSQHVPRTIRLARSEEAEKRSIESLYRGKFLGEGGFSVCFEYRSARGTLALKIIPKTKLKAAKAAAIMQNELVINRMLHHPNIVAFSECFQDDRNVYLVLELCSHGTLFDVLVRRKKLPENEIAFYLSQMLLGLQYLHSNRILHLDLKPENIFIADDFTLKIGDFGVSKQIEPDGACKLLGKTLLYAAPEVLNKQCIGVEADVWSLGVMLYVMLVGSSPFDASTRQDMKRKILMLDYAFPKHLRSNAPINQLIASMMQLSPRDRPSLLEIQQSSFMQSYQSGGSWSSCAVSTQTKPLSRRSISPIDLVTTKVTGA